MQLDGAPRPPSQGPSFCPQQSRHHPFLRGYFSRSDSSFFRSRASRRAPSLSPSHQAWLAMVPALVTWPRAGEASGKIPSSPDDPTRRGRVLGTQPCSHTASPETEAASPLGPRRRGRDPHPHERRHAESWRPGGLHRILRTYRIPSFSPRALLQRVL